MNSAGPVGIICAMESEAKKLYEALENKEIQTYSGSAFYSGTLCGKPAVVVQCGVGKVNAARITQALIDRYSVSCVINSGIAGGVGTGLNVGDIVVGAGLVQHDFDVTPLGYAKGYVFYGDTDKPTVFRSDESLCAALEEAARSCAPRRHVKEGIIASGDVFVAKRETKAELREDFDALAAEMEGGAIAQTAALSGVPFIVLRAISDLADGTSHGSFTEFEQQTADLSAAVLERMVRNFTMEEH